MPYMNNKGTDRPAHPHSLFNAFVVCGLDSIIPPLAIAEISWPQLVSSAEQAGLSIIWSQTTEDRFAHDEAHMDRVKRTWYLLPMREAKVQASLRIIQAVSQEEPSNRKPDPWPLWMAGHAQLNFNMTECSKTQIRLTGLSYYNLPSSLTMNHFNPNPNVLWLSWMHLK